MWKWTPRLIGDWNTNLVLSVEPSFTQVEMNAPIDRGLKHLPKNNSGTQFFPWKWMPRLIGDWNVIAIGKPTLVITVWKWMPRLIGDWNTSVIPGILWYDFAWKWMPRLIGDWNTLPILQYFNYLGRWKWMPRLIGDWNIRGRASNIKHKHVVVQ